MKQNQDLTVILCKGKLPTKWRINDVILQEVSKGIKEKLFIELAKTLGSTLEAIEYQRDYLHLSINNKNYVWDNKKRKWFRELAVKTEPPKYLTILVYGNFNYRSIKTKNKYINFFYIRIPGKGVSWSKVIYSKLKNIVKKLSDESSVSKKDFYFNCEIIEDKAWDSKKVYKKRFEWKKDRFVEKRK